MLALILRALLPFNSPAATSSGVPPRAETLAVLHFDNNTGNALKGLFKKPGSS